MGHDSNFFQISVGNLLGYYLQTALLSDINWHALKNWLALSALENNIHL